MRVIVCDSGPVIHLSEISQLDLLKNCGAIHVPSLVCEEVQRNIKIEWPSWITVNQLKPAEKGRAEFWVNTGDLHRGETEAFELLKRLDADWFLTDDAGARLFVSNIGFEVHGTLGVILWNLANRHIDKEQTEKSILNLRKSSLWLSEMIIQKAVQAVHDISN